MKDTQKGTIHSRRHLPLPYLLPWSQSCEVRNGEDKTLINAFSIYVCSHPFDRRGNGAKIMVYLDIKGGRDDRFCVEMVFVGSDMEMDEVSLLPVVC